MRSIIRATAVLLFAFICSAAIASETQPTQPSTSGEAQMLLKEMSDAFVALKSFSCEMKSEMSIKAEGQNQQMPSSYKAALLKPNKLALIPGEGMSAVQLLSDGQKFTTYFAELEQYTEAPAPEKLDKAWIDGVGEQPYLQMNIAAWLFLDLSSEDPYSDLMENVSELQDLGSETVSEINARHIRGLQEEYDWDMWIQESPRMAPVKMTLDLAKSFNKAAEQMAGQEDMAEYREKLKQMEIKIDLNISNWEFDSELADETFVFTAPAGAKKVESFFAGQQEPSSDLEGKPAPEFELELLGGGKMSPASHKGKDIVILDFWATWCPPCVEGLPTLAKIAEEFKDKNVVFYAVNQDEDEQTVQKFLKEHDLKLQVPMDKGGEVGQKYGVSGIPTTVFIDKDGVVQAVHVGFSPQAESGYRKDLEALLAGKKLAGETEAATQP